ncbi:maestro heat-like repeat-containing protein family member 6 [Paroedura picta]|uniref:maestro heat-like repeat-containing protein family member 6 n=1 Tax=Paroedura picta TaxID=143630 RepID=UPI004057A27D
MVNNLVVQNCEWTLACCNDFLGWKLLEEIEVLSHYDSQEALSQICKHLVQLYLDRVPTFLTHTLDYMEPHGPVAEGSHCAHRVPHLLPGNYRCEPP